MDGGSLNLTDSYNVLREYINLSLYLSLKKAIHFPPKKEEFHTYFVQKKMTCNRNFGQSTVKPVHGITSINQSPVLRGHLFLVLS